MQAVQAVLAAPFQYTRGSLFSVDRHVTVDNQATGNKLASRAHASQAFPAQMIICNHISMPLGIASFAVDYGWAGATAEAWRAGITALAACPNVFVKLGGRLRRGPSVILPPLYSRLYGEYL